MSEALYYCCGMCGQYFVTDHDPIEAFEKAVETFGSMAFETEMVKVCELCYLEAMHGGDEDEVRDADEASGP